MKINVSLKLNHQEFNYSYFTHNGLPNIWDRYVRKYSSKMLTQSDMLQNLGIPVIGLIAFRPMLRDRICLTIKLHF